MKLEDHELFRKLLSLQLTKGDYAVFGSGPMYIHGLRYSIHDLDLIARGRAWEEAIWMGKPSVTEKGKGNRILLFGGDIEIFDAWAPGEWDINDLIDNAEVFEGMRFVRLEYVLEWKKMMGREKDMIDIHRIESYYKETVHRSE